MKKMMFAALALAATAACSDAHGGSAQPLAPLRSDSLGARGVAWRTDLRAGRAELLAADRAHSAATEARGFVEGFTAPLADDARVLLASTGLLRGREAATAYIAGSGLARSRMRWETFRAEVSADGRTGYTFGGGVYTRANGTTAYSRNLAFWKRGEDGAWKVAALLVNLTNTATRPAPEGFGTRHDNGVRGAHPTDPAVSAAEAMQADRDFAALSQATTPGNAFMAFAAADGVVMGGPTYGKEEIGAEFDPTSGLRIVWGPIEGGASGSGDLAFTIGLATTLAPQPDGTVATLHSKYLTVWQKQPSGEWRYLADGGNSRPAGAN